MTNQFGKLGFTVRPQCVSVERLAKLRDELDGALAGAGRRNLLADSTLVCDSAEIEMPRCIASLCGPGYFPVRALLFDKTPQTNWKVSWHQDLSIAVAERREIDGFNGWSLKEDVWHVQPPAELLERMLTVRLHLDDCGPEQGPLHVLPGSHCAGRLDTDDIAAWRTRVPVEEIHCRAGDALVMRPLLLHASAKARRPARRRVLHVEFACEELPAGLQWAAATSPRRQRAPVPAEGRS